MRNLRAVRARALRGVTTGRASSASASVGGADGWMDGWIIPFRFVSKVWCFFLVDPLIALNRLGYGTDHTRVCVTSQVGTWGTLSR